MTTTTNIADLQHDLTPLAEHLAEIQDSIRGLEREADRIKDAIRAKVATAGPGTYGAGSHVVTVSLNRRLDLAAVAAAYPPSSAPELYTLKPDTALVRRHLPQAALEDFMVEQGEPRVSVKAES